MFWLRNKKDNFQLRTLIWGPADVSSSGLGSVIVAFLDHSNLFMLSIYILKLIVVPL